MKKLLFSALFFCATFTHGQTTQPQLQECFLKLPKSFQQESKKDVTTYVGNWPAIDGLCQGILFQGAFDVDGKVKAIYAYSATGNRPAGEVPVDVTIKEKTATFTLPWKAEITYLLREGRSFYRDTSGIYEGVITLK